MNVNNEGIIHETSEVILRRKMEELIEKILWKLFLNRGGFITSECSFFSLLRRLEDLEIAINNCSKDMIENFRRRK